ncbi:MAG: ClpXP protease specificity-enhancing factor [Chitinophagaceae bacterium]|nr:ClpXP protease specificity-enhancing factor [Polaromonas sp.]
MNELETSSTRPYLVRALYEWCTDNGLTPYVAVAVDETVQVPREYVKNNEIVLNISFDATSSLQLDNEFIAFKARFGGSAREIMVPMARVIAIYARENGQGMTFPMGAVSAVTLKQPDTLVDGTHAGASLAVVASTSAQASPANAHAHAPDHKVMKLVPTDPNTPEDGTNPEPPGPPEPIKPAGGRPALKRVK